MGMRWLILSWLLVANVAHAEGAGEHLAQPFTVLITQRWLYNLAVPVYQVSLEHADEHSHLRAAEAAVASVRPEFRKFSAAMINTIDLYVTDQEQQGSVTVIYIRRSIIADWLITS